MGKVKTLSQIEKERAREEVKKMANGPADKRSLRYLIKGIKKGLKKKDKEKVKDSIIKFVTMPETKGMFLDESGEPMKKRLLLKEPADKLIKEFKQGLKEFEDHVNNM